MAVLLAIAAFVVGAVLVSGTTYTRINLRASSRERAFQLADSGILAAIMNLNDEGSGEIPADESQRYFSSTQSFGRAAWGFSTIVTDISSDRKRVVSTGRYAGDTATVTADVELDSESRNVHAIFAHAIYAGNSDGSTNYTLDFGGTGSGADKISGDVYSGNNIVVQDHAVLRNPESFTDENGDGEYDDSENWLDSNATTVFSNGITLAEFNAYVSSIDETKCYPNGKYDFGEAFVDSIGNGVYDEGEAFTDVDGDGVRDFGEPFTDLDGDEVRDAGEPYVDLGNGAYDPGEEFEDQNGNGVWDADPPEPFEDAGNGVYDEGEAFVDQNGVYDVGEQYFDDRNGRFDYGTQAVGSLEGMPEPGPGQQAAEGGDSVIDPPDLQSMFYSRDKTGARPDGALDGWGHDVDVAHGLYDQTGRITDPDDPRHIFVKNPSGVQYEKISGKDDYFLEDPTDASYGQAHQFIDVRENGNNKVYFVDGNLYIHNPDTYDFMFRNAGVRVTIVASGNITISDEFWYNGGTEDPQDSLCLIAMKDPGEPNSGNVYLGDAQFGTGGDIHAMLYAEDDFVDNNLDTAGQPHLTVFGNMTAGDQVRINRGGAHRTRLDVTLDERIVSREWIPPGLPSAGVATRRITVVNSWSMVAGSWHSHSTLQ